MKVTVPIESRGYDSAVTVASRFTPSPAMIGPEGEQDSAVVVGMIEQATRSSSASTRSFVEGETGVLRCPPLERGDFHLAGHLARKSIVVSSFGRTLR
jgi:hypothetical protein